uniref:Uncharacterized protein n=1 Tax=Medicago truncatula TaxID=3880 RepID=I3S4A0_MEDTR|nr:unknown [Medicago truncatula]
MKTFKFKFISHEWFIAKLAQLSKYRLLLLGNLFPQSTSLLPYSIHFCFYSFTVKTVTGTFQRERSF